MRSGDICERRDFGCQLIDSIDEEIDISSRINRKHVVDPRSGAHSLVRARFVCGGAQRKRWPAALGCVSLEERKLGSAVVDIKIDRRCEGPRCWLCPEDHTQGAPKRHGAQIQVRAPIDEIDCVDAEERSHADAICGSILATD